MRMHIWQCKTQELPGLTIAGLWIPAKLTSFGDSTALHWQNLNEKFLAPLIKNLDL